jgi:hypothetical protein
MYTKLNCVRDFKGVTLDTKPYNGLHNENEAIPITMIYSLAIVPIDTIARFKYGLHIKCDIWQ